MKKLFSIFTLSMCTNLFSQPVIVDGSKKPVPGFTAQVSMLTSSSNADIIAGGPNHTWDFRSYAFTSAGNLNIISPSTAPMGSLFPTANLAYSFGGTYSFFNVSASKQEVQAYTATSAGTGKIYLPNPKTTLKFPFSYGDSVSDSWQTIDGGPSSVTLHYDSYGTLISQSGTYKDVVRIREGYGPESDYQWYTLNPLFTIAIFDHNKNMLYQMSYPTTTKITLEEKSNSTFEVIASPRQSTITINNLELGATLSVSDLSGKTLYTTSIVTQTLQLEKSKFNSGVHIIHVIPKGGGTALCRKIFINP